ncbi:hypothetical protein SAMN05877753_12013 [Bacillus oleivorans]|uniref:Uncharacterized protein n=1 Tax=Bacillus oleivorans TaxID=1448271 RepID=A0A285D982_9BACI|nr:hypothetical protein [Bacillus oleivorans]SNX75876.1 hypothetical protein SAMN05877753_12013 [Bacillus oleivorans]
MNRIVQQKEGENVIVIHFECKSCECKDGQLELPYLVCRACGSKEKISDFDIVGHGTEVE